MSNVVKADRAQDYRRAVVMNLADVEAEAARILGAARARAAAVVEAGRVDAEAARVRAAEEGRRAGVAEGREAGRALGAEEGREDAYAKAHDEIASLASSLVCAAEDFAQRKESLLLQAQKDLLALSLLIARKIVGREIEADRHVTFDNVSRCLETLSTQKNLVVRVAPLLVETVDARLPELARRLGDLSAVKVVADESISPGGCVITGQRGMLDATVETQFAEVERVLFGDGNA